MRPSFIKYLKILNMKLYSIETRETSRKHLEKYRSKNRFSAVALIIATVFEYKCSTATATFYTH